MTISWNITPELYFYNISKRQIDGIERDIVALINSMTDEVQAWMQSNARWEDRTGAARAGLYADIEHIAREYAALLMSHGPAIDYAWYLETLRNGRYSILGDTVDHFAPVLIRGVQEIIRKHSS